MREKRKRRSLATRLRSTLTTRAIKSSLLLSKTAGEWASFLMHSRDRSRVLPGVSKHAISLGTNVSSGFLGQASNQCRDKSQITSRVTKAPSTSGPLWESIIRKMVGKSSGQSSEGRLHATACTTPAAVDLIWPGRCAAAGAVMNECPIIIVAS
jgi:hypothetical protein